MAWGAQLDDMQCSRTSRSHASSNAAIVTGKDVRCKARKLGHADRMLYVGEPGPWFLVSLEAQVEVCAIMGLQCAQPMKGCTTY